MKKQINSQIGKINENLNNQLKKRKKLMKLNNNNR